MSRDMVDWKYFLLNNIMITRSPFDTEDVSDSRSPLDTEDVSFILNQSSIMQDYDADFPIPILNSFEITCWHVYNKLFKS